MNVLSANRRDVIRNTIGAGRLAAMALLSILVAGCADIGLPAPGDGPSQEKADGIAYDWDVVGVPEEMGDLRGRLNDSSRLKGLAEQPPLTVAGLKRRAQEDRNRFEGILRADGYYGAAIETRIDETSDPVQVVVGVALGPQYKLSSFDIAYVGDVSESLPKTMADLGLKPDMPALSDAILKVEGDVLRTLGQQGRPLARIDDRKFVVDHATETMAAVLTIDPGPPTQFGPLSVAGLESVSESYLRRLMSWREGAEYDQRVIDTLNNRLYDTGLFESVSLRHGDQVQDAGKLPVTLEVVEAKSRSVGVGVNYSTDQGAGAEASWEHRNLLGEGESLKLSVTAAMTRQRLAADFLKPNYKRLDQNLLIDSEVLRQESDAYDSQSISLFTGFSRRLSKKWTAKGGGSFEYSVIHENGEKDIYALFGIPLSVSRDSRNDVLDPTEGSVLSLSLTPYLGTIEETAPFVQTGISGSTYAALDSDRRIVAAGRLKVQSIAGSNTRSIPATKRLYAGGGGSVRGYEFQKVGPLDGENDPLGGRSLAEIGAELRFRATDDFGIVPFVDGGIVNDDPIPDFSTDIQWAAGLGFRYYSPVGPLRADIAIPLNGREGIDDDFQIYLSLGQSF